MRVVERRSIWAIAVVLLIGALLRLPLTNRNERFQVDEALYASIARKVLLQGDLYLIDTVIDKPPLLFWAIAGSFKVFGQREFAARLPNCAASLLTLALIYALAKRLYADQRLALLAALLLAVSPFDRAFAATAFTDPLLTMFVLAGCWWAVGGRWRLAGLALALAFMTKPSALQWLPLAILLGAIRVWRWQRALRGGWQFAQGFVLGGVPLLIWSATRAVIPDFWAFNLYNNSPGRLIRAEEMIPRLTLWLGWLNTIAPLPLIGWLSGPLARFGQRVTWRLSAKTAVDLTLTGYTLGSLALWWLVAFPIYDRYLHTLAPLLLLLCARVALIVADRFKISVAALLLLAVFTPLLTTPWAVGGDPQQWAGIDQLAATLDALPAGTVVYDHSLGWELGYYLGPTPPIQLTWQPTVDDLIAAIRTAPGYWVAPRPEADRWLYLLQAAGVTVVEKPLGADSRFVLCYLAL